MFKFTELPDWCLTGTKPAFYDTESATAVEQTAKIYGALKTLTKETEVAVNQINNVVEEFKKGIIESQECFEVKINKIMHDYIISIDEKIKNQDLIIDNAVDYMTTNLKISITELITEMKNNGELDEAVLNAIDNIGSRVATLENTEYTLVYEEGTENLILQKTVKEGE